MSETLIDSKTVGSGGGTESGSCSSDGANDELALIVRGDSNSSDFDVAVTGVAFGVSGTLVEPNFSASVTNADATTDSNNDQAIRLTGVRGYRRIEITVTNNAGSDTTVTVEQVEY